MDFGKAVRILRATRNLQQRELAQMCALDPSYVSLIESGKRKPSLEVLETIARATHVPVPLITMLAAEREDVKDIAPNDLDRLARQLLDVVLQAK